MQTFRGYLRPPSCSNLLAYRLCHDPHRRLLPDERPACAVGNVVAVKPLRGSARSCAKNMSSSDWARQGRSVVGDKDPLRHAKSSRTWKPFAVTRRRSVGRYRGHDCQAHRRTNSVCHLSLPVAYRSRSEDTARSSGRRNCCIGRRWRWKLPPGGEGMRNSTLVRRF